MTSAPLDLADAFPFAAPLLLAAFVSFAAGFAACFTADALADDLAGAAFVVDFLSDFLAAGIGPDFLAGVDFAGLDGRADVVLFCGFASGFFDAVDDFDLLADDLLALALPGSDFFAGDFVLEFFFAAAFLSSLAIICAMGFDFAADFLIGFLLAIRPLARAFYRIGIRALIIINAQTQAFRAIYSSA